jgi:hypothetical protein
MTFSRAALTKIYAQHQTFASPTALPHHIFIRQYRQNNGGTKSRAAIVHMVLVMASIQVPAPAEWFISLRLWNLLQIFKEF